MCVEAYGSEDELQEYVREEYEHSEDGVDLRVAERAELFQRASDLLEEEGSVSEEDLDELSKGFSYLSRT